MYEIEFCIDNWVRERRDNLYHRRHNRSRRRRQRLIWAVIFLCGVIAGLAAVSFWPVIYTPSNADLDATYHISLLIMLLCVAVCVVSALGFFHSTGQLRIHLPGTKLDYDGPNIRESCRMAFGPDSFTLWRGGGQCRYSYRDIHQVFRDRRGLLLADLDLYIPLETIPGPLRRRILQKFTRLTLPEKIAEKMTALFQRQ